MKASSESSIIQCSSCYLFVRWWARRGDIDAQQLSWAVLWVYSECGRRRSKAKRCFSNHSEAENPNSSDSRTQQISKKTSLVGHRGLAAHGHFPHPTLINDPRPARQHKPRDNSRSPQANSWNKLNIKLFKMAPFCKDRKEKWKKKIFQALLKK